MKYFPILFLSLTSFIAFAQNNSDLRNEPNIVEKKTACFYKDRPEPFNGNVMIEDTAAGLYTKLRVDNGFGTISEVYDQQNKLVQVQKNGIDIDVTKGCESIFPENTKFQKVDDITLQVVFLSYSGSSEKKILYEDVLEYNMTRLHYKKGIRTKIEYFFDADYKQIKARYNLFYTVLGNIEYDDITDIYDGDYTIWNENGKVIEKGEYEMGKKRE